MNSSRSGWTNILRRQGKEFSAWVVDNNILSKKFDVLSQALWTLLESEISTPEQAQAVWRAVPAVLRHCNEQATYKIPGATLAYAWLHLLDRYARTWVALEILVSNCCIPMAKYGVRTLDVGTGPGPSAFAIYDFYSTMTEFATATRNDQWNQSPTIVCVEFDYSTNHFRHNLAEIIFQQAGQEHEGILAMCHALLDFGEIMPTEERKRLLKAILWAEDRYFDELEDEWVSVPIYTADEANDLAQSRHRYRLIVFSNFLTTVGTMKDFEPNLVDILTDAHPGSAVMVLGGRGGPYPEIYDYVDHLTKPTGFELLITGEQVSSADTEIADRVFEEGAKVYEHLQSLAPDLPDNSAEAKRVKAHFSRSREAAPSSQLWVYRKHRWTQAS